MIKLSMLVCAEKQEERPLFYTASNHELKPTSRVETKNGPISRGSQWYVTFVVHIFPEYKIFGISTTQLSRLISLSSPAFSESYLAIAEAIVTALTLSQRKTLFKHRVTELLPCVEWRINFTGSLGRAILARVVRRTLGILPVSYTHLTLPTIYSV